MKRRINRRNGVGILMAAVVAAGSLQVPALAQVEAAECSGRRDNNVRGWQLRSSKLSGSTVKLQ